MKRYRMINLICVILSAGFLFGIVWVWRGADEIDYEAEARLAVGIEDYKIGREDYKIERLKDYDLVDKNQTNEELKDYDSENDVNNLPILQSSNLSVSTTPIIQQPPPSLPSKYLLAVPFTSQAPEKNWDQPWQDACEEAAVLMLDAYYKKYNLSPLFAKDEILKMIKWEEEQGWGNSLGVEKVKELVENFVFKTQNTRLPEPEAQADGGQAINKTQRKVRIVENPTIEDIKKFIANGRPVLVMADGKVLPNPHFRNGGPVYHALIIRGYTETEFITNDPGTQFGKGFRYKYEDLLNAVHDWNGGDVKNGKRAVLVVE